MIIMNTMNILVNFFLLHLIRVILIAVTLLGCAPTSSTNQSQTLMIATTTSTRDSGLMDILVPAFKTETGIDVKVIAVGSGQALEMGKRGDADLLLTHSPVAEEAFMKDGFGETRAPVMYNDFVLVGPGTDPAGVNNTNSIVRAFQNIAAKQVSFISRGDESGTHVKEISIWQASNIEVSQPWYIESGNGMAATLRMTSEKQAYTLSDRGTYLAQRDSLDLAILMESDPKLHNPYTVITINQKKYPHLNHKAARQFADFLQSTQAQQLIASHGVQEFGQPLFFPHTAEE